jgi:hypothetical protein
MADGAAESAFARPKRTLWTEFFRCFWIALDPRKLLVAAAGILATSFGWWLLASVTWGLANEPKADSAAYGKAQMIKEVGKDAAGNEFADEVYAAEGKKRFEVDVVKYTKLKDLAGPGGKLRSLPWDESRGDNPYLVLQNLIGGTDAERRGILARFVPNQAPVLLEPLFKLLLPIFVITDPDATFGTKVFCFLCLVWGLAVWAFAGGVITRIAAVQLSGKDRISLSEAIFFVQRRYLHYLISPLIPIGFILAALVLLIVYGLIGMIPFVGDVVFLALLFPVVLFGGLVMAVILISLVGYPLMFTTISVEGSDTFDALSRSWNYVFTSPGRYFGYGAIAVLFGMAVTFVVVLAGSMTVYLGKWGVNSTAATLRPSHTPDYLFVNAPKTLGWRELLTRGSDIEWTGTPNAAALADPELKEFAEYRNPAAAKKYLGSYWAYHTFSTWLVSFWLFAVLLFMLGFSYSYFWSASTVLYQLMRYRVDDIELDEVHLESSEPETPLAAPAPVPVAPPTGGTALPMVPPAPPATVPFPPTPPTVPPPTDGPKT